MAAHDRSGVVKYAAQVITANKLSVEELELQLDSLWKSGYHAGRKATLKQALMNKGLASIRRMRAEAMRRPEIAISKSKTTD